MRIIVLAAAMALVVMASSRASASCLPTETSVQTPDICHFHQPPPVVRRPAGHSVIVQHVVEVPQQICMVVFSDTTPPGKYDGLPDYMEVLTGPDPNGPMNLLKGWRQIVRGENHIRLPCSAAYAAVIDLCFHGNDLHHEKLYGDDLLLARRKIEAGERVVVINPRDLHFYRKV